MQPGSPSGGERAAPSTQAASDGACHDTLAGAFRETRSATEALCDGLATEDFVVQSMPDASPTKWHLAHSTWYFETFLLGTLPGYEPFDPHYAYLFNSYYNSVGAQYPRPERGLLTRPTVEQVLAYRSHVDDRMLELLGSDAEHWGHLASVVELGIHHEQQHQELMLTDLKHAFSRNPLRPAYRPSLAECRNEASPMRFVRFEEGTRWIGHDGKEFSFDNERPRHPQLVPAFELASRPVSCGEFAVFLQEGGYQRPEFWLADGWATVQQEGWEAPLYWEKRDGDWWQMTLTGMRRIDPLEPVCHVSLYEADAYARFVDCRLPTEREWEVAAQQSSIRGNFLESGRCHPAPPRESGDGELFQIFGDVWEWTRSPYEPYPHYEPPPGAIGEYNGKFMCNQFVLRGGSCATPRSHIRPTYRNFFPPDARWQFSGFRLARYS